MSAIRGVQAKYYEVYKLYIEEYFALDNEEVVPFTQVRLVDKYTQYT